MPFAMHIKRLPVAKAILLSVVLSLSHLRLFADADNVLQCFVHGQSSFSRLPSRPRILSKPANRVRRHLDADIKTARAALKPAESYDNGTWSQLVTLACGLMLGGLVAVGDVSAAPAQSQGGKGQPQYDRKLGESQFKQNCAGCHAGGEKLALKNDQLGDVRKIIDQWRKAHGSCGLLQRMDSDEITETVADYVRVGFKQHSL